MFDSRLELFSFKQVKIIKLVNKRIFLHNTVLTIGGVKTRFNFQTLTERRNLHCYYKRDNDFLYVAPLKVELLNLDPRIVLFHEVVSKNEMELLKAFAAPLVS